jgi:NO-binding membrane sensor protein with MHYT domain/serine phosphatase RsbU (regulator of sigma subunit)
MTDQTLLGSYDHRLVVLSVLIAILASYTALDLAGRVTASRGWPRRAWLISGATSMGAGIWSMHYIGMLAFRLPVPIRYDWPTALLSLFAGIFSSVVALVIVSRQKMGLLSTLAGSIFMGGSIVAMHYIAMFSMRLAVMCRYSPSLVALSVLLAIGGSSTALWLAFFFRDEVPGRGKRKIASAFLMAAAIAGMHYTAMAAASFTASSTPPDLSHAVSVSALGIAGISGVPVMVLVITLLTALAERKRVEQELALAEEAQRSLLPRSLPQFAPFRIHAFCRPTRHVSGDFYDFISIDTGELVGVLADVSGKGISAALLGSFVLGAMNVEFRTTPRLGAILDRLNKLLCHRTPANRFVTLALFLLNTQGKGEFLSAGHNVVYLFRAASRDVEELLSSGMPLGMFPFASYQSSALELHLGDILVVYSDGLTDAQNHAEEEFGEKRLRNLIQSEGSAGADALKKHLLGAIQEFTAGTNQVDDITFLLVERGS